jgi:hypothetical protein
MLGGVRECLGHDVVGGHLGALGQPAVEVDAEFDGHRRTAGERLERRLELDVGG